MTPPIFAPGNKVEIIGVTCDGRTEYMGKAFKISQYHFDSNEERCSDVGLPWYPASSLRLVEEPVFNIGDKVRITNGADDHYEATFVVDIKLSDRNKYSCKKPFSDGQSVPYYSGRFLEKVEEELKIGDWVRCHLPERIFQIEKIGFSDWNKKTCCTDGDLHEYYAEDLQKLTPEEVVFHTGTIGYKMQECSEEIEKATEAMRDLLAPLVDDRLSAIEERLDELDTSIDSMKFHTTTPTKRWMDEIDSRLNILEGERPEVCTSQEPGKVEVVYIKPQRKDINITITVGENNWCIMHPPTNCPEKALEWCKSVLDSMREA